MKSTTRGLVLALALLPAAAPAAPVVPARPRLLLDPATKARLLAKVAANDPSWQALEARANALASYSIFPYEYANRTAEPDGTIFYDYQGAGWLAAAMPLGLAWQMTGDQKYAAKLVALADEMIRAQSDPQNNPPNGLPPLEPDDYYPTRYLGEVAGVIYDWCWDQLGEARRAQMRALMEAYFDDLRANAYQVNSNADGNYMPGHMLCAAAMGYAIAGDDARAQEMIDFARIRFDGTPGSVPAANVPDSHFDQLFAGGYLPVIAKDYNGPLVTGAPFLGGFDFQGWAYGSGTYARVIDYALMVKSATGEDLLTPHLGWWSQVLRAEKHALFGNGFEIDPSGDWGGDQGAVVPREVPARLAAILAGTPDGPGAQWFLTNDIKESTFPEAQVYPLSEWEAFLFADPSRPAAAMSEPPYHSGFAPACPRAGTTNGAMPYFVQRHDWGAEATWSSYTMGAAYYDDHQHTNAGNLVIHRGDDYLLVEASSWMGPAGSHGISGGSNEEDDAASSNTLFFDDFGDFMWTDEQYFGGQGDWGRDQVVAAEQTGDLTYVRSDLTSAYDRSADPADQAGRKLDLYYRSALYLRSADLFVVFDEVKVEPSANPRGPYRRHLRWHLPSRPVVSGTTAQLDQGASRLYLDAVLPSPAQLTVVDESQNTDPCDGTVPSCVPYANAQSGTFRVEVKDGAGKLDSPFLTVLTPGPAGLAHPAIAPLSTGDGAMTGAVIAAAGETDVVLFNAGPGQVPAPVTATSYAWSGPVSAWHVLCGLQPGAGYAVASSNGTVSVMQDAAGPLVASPAGVLRFQLAGSPAAPVADFTFSPASPTTADAVTFDDASANGATSFAWDFGDGATATGATAVHRYLEPGTYAVVHTATNAAGSATRTKAVTVGAGAGGGATTTVVVPIVLSSAGANGSFYTSELTIANHGASAATLTLTYTAAFGGGGGIATDTIAPGSAKGVPDAVAYLIAQGVPIPASGNRGGTLAVTFSGLAAASDARVVVRTTTAVPQGRAGLAYAGTPRTAALGDGPVFLCGLRQNATDRSNVAFVHAGSPADGPLTLRYEVIPADPALPLPPAATVTLAPGGFAQVSQVLASVAPAISEGYVRVERVSGSAPWLAYAVINDQANSDGSYVPPLVPADVAGRSGLVLPVVVETGAYSSEVVLANTSAAAKQVLLTYVAEGVASPDHATSITLPLAAGAQVRFPGFVEEMRRRGAPGLSAPGLASYAGALFASVPGGDVGGLFLGGRTTDPDPVTGGFFGVFLAAAPSGSGATTTAWLDGLRQDSEDRTNVALVNTGEVDASSDVFRLEIFDASSGALAATVENVTLAPRGWMQIDSLLARYAPGTAAATVRVTRTAGANPFLAYAVVNDGGAPGERSGDGAYVPMEVPDLP